MTGNLKHTNRTFSKLVGCHITTASTWRNGRRLPNAYALLRIHEALEIPFEELFAVWRRGPKDFSAYLRQFVFDPSENKVAA